MISSILTYLVVGLIAVVGISLALALVGAVFGLALGLAKFLLFTIGPILLIGYVVVRLLAPRSQRLSKAEKDWLES
ncbi:MAG: hypothetical protein R3314_10955 [Longimicrobiales bacterium]|nr:hypothetical protein [Longimicrobiales bacterium]